MVEEVAKQERRIEAISDQNLGTDVTAWWMASDSQDPGGVQDTVSKP